MKELKKGIEQLGEQNCVTQIVNYPKQDSDILRIINMYEQDGKYYITAAYFKNQPEQEYEQNT